MSPSLSRPSGLRAPARSVRPLRRRGAGPAALDAADRAILERCDGRLSVLELAASLGVEEDARGLVDLTAALLRLEERGLLDRSASPHAPVKIVMGLEDTTYFHWQLAILCESLHTQLPPRWEIVPVVCNGHRPLSERLERICRVYGVRPRTGRDLATGHPLDFAGGGERYTPLHRIEALAVARETARDDEIVCLMDTDVFLYRELDVASFPETDAVCPSALIAAERFFATPEGHPGVVDLAALLRAIGAQGPFRPGGVTVFLRGRTLRDPKLVADSFRFTEALYLLGRIGGATKLWHAEMPCFALALTANGIPYELVDEAGARFVIDKRPTLQPGAFYHYYADLADGGVDGAFRHSRWCKQGYRERSLLDADLDALRAGASSDHERFFFALAERARLRLG